MRKPVLPVRFAQVILVSIARRRFLLFTRLDCGTEVAQASLGSRPRRERLG